MDVMMNNGNWDGIMAATTTRSASNSVNNSVKSGSHKSGSHRSGSHNNSNNNDNVFDMVSPVSQQSNTNSRSSRNSGASRGSKFTEDVDTFFNSTHDRSVSTRGNKSNMSLTSEEIKRRDKYRVKVEELVRKGVPDEIDNISAMMDQFAGREEELISALEKMTERS